MHPVRTVSDRRQDTADGKRAERRGSSREITAGSPVKAVKANRKTAEAKLENSNSTVPPRKLPSLQCDVPTLALGIEIVDGATSEQEVNSARLGSMGDSRTMSGSLFGFPQGGGLEASPTSRGMFRRFSTRDVDLSEMAGLTAENSINARPKSPADSPRLSPRHSLSPRSVTPRGGMRNSPKPASREGGARSDNHLLPESEDRGELARARKQSMDLARAVTVDMAFEVNEMYRNKQAKIASEHGTTRLLDEELEQRLHLWMSLVAFARSAEIIQETVTRSRSMMKLAHVFAPMLTRAVLYRRAMKARKARIRAALSTMERATVEGLKRLPAFANWPDQSVQNLLDKCYPVCLKAGEPVCLEGDTGDRMYIIQSGEVDIYVRRPTDGKSRRAGLKVATLGPPAPFGEYSIVCNEPRFASVYAAGEEGSEEEVHLWAIDRETVKQEIDELPREVFTELMTFSQARREQNLGKLHPLRPSVLQSSSVLFSCFAVEALTELCKNFKPSVIRKKTTFYTEDQQPEFLYFIAEGSVELRRSHAPNTVVKLKAGQSFGDMEMLWNEKRMYTATSVFADLWLLSKEDFIDVLPVQYPAMFLAAKEAVENARADTATPCDRSIYLKHPLITKYIAVKRLKAIELIPRVIGKGDVVLRYGDPFMGPICITEGTCRETKTSGVTYTKGAMVGAREFLNFKTIWDITLVARDKCEVWTIPAEALAEDLKALKAAGGLDKVKGDECTVAALGMASPKQGSSTAPGGLDVSMSMSRRLSISTADASPRGLSPRRGSHLGSQALTPRATTPRAGSPAAGRRGSAISPKTKAAK